MFERSGSRNSYDEGPTWSKRPDTDRAGSLRLLHSIFTWFLLLISLPRPAHMAPHHGPQSRPTKSPSIRQAAALVLYLAIMPCLRSKLIDDVSNRILFPSLMFH